MKISKKILLFSLFNALIPVLVVGVFSYFNTRHSLSEQISTQINNTANRQAAKIEDALAHDQEELRATPTAVTVLISLHQYLQNPTPANKAAVDRDLAETHLYDSQYRRIHLLDNNGTVVSSTDPSFVGKSYKNTEVFRKAKDGSNVTTFFKDVDGDVAQYRIALQSINGLTINAYVLAEAPVERYKFITSDYTDLGKTGETLLLSKKDSGGYEYLTPTRFNSKAALTAFQRHPANGRDYRNHPVLSVWRNIPNTPWAIEIKMDQAEIYRPVTQLRNLAVIIIVATSIVATVLGMVFSRKVTLPIRKFTEVVQRIEGGNLNERVQITSRDEIGMLGEAFNRLTSSLVESRARLTASIMSLPFGFAIIDTEGRIVFTNAVLAKIVGHDIPQDTGQSHGVLQQLTGDFKDSLDLPQLIKEAETKGQSIERNIEYGSKFLRLLVAPIVAIDNHVLGTILIVEDTTEQVALNRSKDEFFSIASHELRTPLSAISGNTNMLLSYYGEQLSKDADMKQMVDDIHDASLRLVTIVNDFLDVSRLEQRSAVLKPTAFELAPLIQDLLREYEAANSAGDLALKLLPANDIPAVFADRDRVRQILVNLLGNSIKYTKKGSVTFSLALQDDHVEVRVTDTGQGIPVRSQHLLFRKFQQAADSILTRDNTRSTGLGLYIAKLLTEDMGGQIRLVQSEEGKGSTFAFTLPVATQELMDRSVDDAADKKAGGDSETQAATM